MLRLIFLAVIVLMPLLGGSSFLLVLLDVGPAAGRIDPLQTPFTVVVSTWLLETIGLVALYLVVEGRCGARWLDGLVTGAIAWIFRGPLVVVTIVTANGGAQGPWWHLALAWWVVYSAAGLVLARLGRPPRPAEGELPREL